MLLGPYDTEDEAIEACGGSSSSSSSSCTREPCPVEIIISGPCGLEISGGFVYSIGSQTVSLVTFADECECVREITVNGESFPYEASDGQLLNIAATTNDGCFFDDNGNPVCILSMLGMSQMRGSKVTMKFMPENIKKILLSRRRVRGASGK